MNPRWASSGNHRHTKLAGIAADAVPVAIHTFHEGFRACIQTAVGRVAAKHESRGTVEQFPQFPTVILDNTLVCLHTPDTLGKVRNQIAQLTNWLFKPVNSKIRLTARSVLLLGIGLPLMPTI